MLVYCFRMMIFVLVYVNIVLVGINPTYCPVLRACKYSVLLASVY